MTRQAPPSSPATAIARTSKQTEEAARKAIAKARGEPCPAP